MANTLLGAILFLSVIGLLLTFRSERFYRKKAAMHYEWLKFLISAEEYHLSQRLLDETITEDQRTAARLFLHRIQKMQDEVGNA